MPKNQLISKFNDWLKKLSKREKALVLFALGFVSLFAIALIVTPVNKAFYDQRARLEQTKLDLKNMGQHLAQYRKLKFRRDKIEAKFRNIEFKEGELSYLERVARERLGAGASLILDAKEVQKYGGSFEQAPFVMRVKVDSLKNMTELLRDLVTGPQAFLLTELSIERSSSSGALDARVSVSSIRQPKENPVPTVAASENIPQ